MRPLASEETLVVGSVDSEETALLPPVQDGPADQTAVMGAVDAASAPVFVDDSGQRVRRLRIGLYAAGLLALLYATLVGVSLAGGATAVDALLPFPDLVGRPGTAPTGTPAPAPQATRPTATPPGDASGGQPRRRSWPVPGGSGAGDLTSPAARVSPSRKGPGAAPPATADPGVPGGFQPESVGGSATPVPAGPLPTPAGGTPEPAAVPGGAP